MAQEHSPNAAEVEVPKSLLERLLSRLGAAGDDSDAETQQLSRILSRHLHRRRGSCSPPREEPQLNLNAVNAAGDALLDAAPLAGFDGALSPASARRRTTSPSLGNSPSLLWALHLARSGSSSISPPPGERGSRAGAPPTKTSPAAADDGSETLSSRASLRLRHPHARNSSVGAASAVAAEAASFNYHRAAAAPAEHEFHALLSDLKSLGCKAHVHAYCRRLMAFTLSSLDGCACASAFLLEDGDGGWRRGADGTDRARFMLTPIAVETEDTLAAAAAADAPAGGRYRRRSSAYGAMTPVEVDEGMLLGRAVAQARSCAAQVHLPGDKAPRWGLTVPVTAADGSILGVIQVVRRAEGGGKGPAGTPSRDPPPSPCRDASREAPGEHARGGSVSSGRGVRRKGGAGGDFVGEEEGVVCQAAELMAAALHVHALAQRAEQGSTPSAFVRRADCAVLPRRSTQQAAAQQRQPAVLRLDVPSKPPLGSGSAADAAMCAVLQKTFDVCRQLLAATGVTLFRMDASGRTLTATHAADPAVLGVALPVGKGLAGTVARDGEPLNVPDAYRDPRFNREVDAKTGFKTRCVLCVPVNDCDGKLLAVVQAVNKQNGSTFTGEDVAVLQHIAHLAGITLHKASVLSPSTSPNKADKHSAPSAAAGDAADPNPASPPRLQPRQPPRHRSTQSLSPQQQQQQSPPHQRSPRPGDSGGGGSGSIGGSGSGGGHRRSSTRGLFAACRRATALSQSFMRRGGGGGGGRRGSEASTSRGAAAAAAAAPAPAAAGPHPAARDSIAARRASEPLSGTLAVRWGALGLGGLGGGNAAAAAAAAHRDLFVWDLDVLSLSRDNMVLRIVAAFQSFGLLSRGLEEATVRAFAIESAARYRPNPYHNFHHAFCVLHATQFMLRSSHIKADRVAVLAALVAAICHDLDHPGHTNSFAVATYSAEAILFSDDSVLERYHAYQAFQLLRRGGKEAFNVLAHLEDPAEYRTARRIITSSILSTDMAHHGELCRILEAAQGIPPVAADPLLLSTAGPSHTRVGEVSIIQGLSGEAAAPRNLGSVSILQAILHAADLCTMTFTPALAFKWGERINAEFKAQAEAEERLGLPVAPHMKGLDDAAFQAKQQCFFVNLVLKPLWSQMARLLPDVLGNEAHDAARDGASVDVMTRLQTVLETYQASHFAPTATA